MLQCQIAMKTKQCHKFGLQTIYRRGFFLPILQCYVANAVTLFSPFSTYKLILVSLFPPCSMILNGKLRFYVLDEASKKRELIAKSYIILNGGLQVEFWKKAQSIIYSLRTITVECCIKL